MGTQRDRAATWLRCAGKAAIVPDCGAGSRFASPRSVQPPPIAMIDHRQNIAIGMVFAQFQRSAINTIKFHRFVWENPDGVEANKPV